MDPDTLHDTNVSVVDGDLGGSHEAMSNDNDTLEEISSNKQVMREVGSAIIGLELELACCSEKLVNMNLLMMHVAERESVFEAFSSEKQDSSVDLMALEFDILSGVFDLEVREMGNFIDKLQTETNHVCEVISSHKFLGEGFLTLEEKLHDAAKSLKQSREQVSELVMQSAKFQRLVSSCNREETSDEDKDATVFEDGDFFNTTAKLKMQTSEQQRHILRMLEKSLARELDLENQLTECMLALDEMKRKLHSSQEEVSCKEEQTTAVYARFLEADNASAVLMGISKDLVGQLQSCQLKINSALHRESESNTKLQNCMQAVQKLEKAAEKSNLEALFLKEKVNSLEEQLKASESMLKNVNAALDGRDEQHEMKALQEQIVIAESRADKAEAECNLLSESNEGLHEELDLLKGSGVSSDKFDSLEKQLKETDIQLQQAVASVEASEETQSMLYASIKDMEILIHKMKSNVSTAEARADKAESDCNLLAEANKELNKELDLLKANSISSEKVVSLEKQLRETDIQLQQAMSSVEASQEKQSMLYSSIVDMENLIEKLKSKVLEADARADSAEDKCIILSESHAELNEELNFLREKVESLEASLQRVEETKLAAAKDVNIRTKVITELVMQLAIEREHLQKQMLLLARDNRALVDKLKMTNKASFNSMNHEGGETEDGVLSSEHRACSFNTEKGNRDVFDTTEVEKSPRDVLDNDSESDPEVLKSKLETVRTIDAGRLSFKYVLSAGLTAFMAALVMCFLWPEKNPF